MKTLLPLSALMLCSGVASAQFGIGTNMVNGSALFELNSTTKGFLPPRMNYSERMSISNGNPADGLVVYQTNDVPNSTAGLYAFKAGAASGSGAWVKVGSGPQDVTGGSINNTPIGQSTGGAAAGTFTAIEGSSAKINNLPNAAGMPSISNDIVVAEAGGVLATRQISTFAAALAGNGLTQNGNKIDLGGALSAPATISAPNGTNSFTIDANGNAGFRLLNLPTSSSSNILTRVGGTGSIQTGEIVSVINSSSNTISATRIGNGITDDQVANDLTITSTKTGSFAPSTTNTIALTVTGSGTGVGLMANNGATVSGRTTTTDLTVNNTSSPVVLGAGGIGTTTSSPLAFVQNGTRAGRVSGNGLTNTGATSTFLGVLSGPAIATNGTANAGFGYGVMQNLDPSATNNTAIGINAMRSTTTGSDNTSAGAGTFDLNQTGNRNTAFGRDAMYSNISGSQNTAPGNRALFRSTGDDNVGLGYQSGYDLTVGSGNTFLGTGVQAGSQNGGGTSPTGISNATAIGYKAQVNASNSVVIGSVSGVNSATSSVNVGIGVNTPSKALHVKTTGNNDPVLFENLQTTTDATSLIVEQSGILKKTPANNLSIASSQVGSGSFNITGGSLTAAAITNTTINGTTIGLGTTPGSAANARFDDAETVDDLNVGDDGFISDQLGVGTTAAAASAQLEVSSTTRGFLPPRMTGNQVLAISNPAEGLMVYINAASTDDQATPLVDESLIFPTKGWYGYNGAAWERLNNL